RIGIVFQCEGTSQGYCGLADVAPNRHLNSFAGVAPFDALKPVKKFTSRKAAVTRIWQAIARLSSDGTQPVEPVATAKGKGKKSPAKVPRRARAQKSPEAGGNKKAEVITMMKRAMGATLAEIMATTGWQAQ